MLQPLKIEFFIAGVLIQDEKIIAQASHNESKIELAKDLHIAEMGLVEDPFKLILGCLLVVLASARIFSLQRKII